MKKYNTTVGNLLNKVNKRTLLMHLMDGITHLSKIDGTKLVDRDLIFKKINTMPDSDIEKVVDSLKARLNIDYLSQYCEEDIGYFTSEYVQFRISLYDVTNKPGKGCAEKPYMK